MSEYEEKKESKKHEAEEKEEKCLNEQQLIAILGSYRGEAALNAEEWQDRASDTWDVINGRMDWSHKADDQSKVHLNRVGLAQQQMKATISQALMNFEDWMEVTPEVMLDDEDASLITPMVAKRIVLRALSGCDIKSIIADNIAIAAVENLLVTKLQPYVKEYKGPGGVIRKEFKIKFTPLNIRNYYTDATGDGLYEIHEEYIPKYKLMAMASDKPSATKPYLKSKIKKLKPMMAESDDKQEEELNQGTENNRTKDARRGNILVQEFWCTVLDDDGDIAKYKTENGELELKDVLITVGNGQCLLADPMPSPNWSGGSNIVKTTLFSQHVNEYGRGLLEAGADMNRIENELFNSAVDAGLKEAHNVSTIKMHGLAAPSQIDGGVRPNTVLLANNSLRPGEKLFETESMGKIPQSLITLIQIVKNAGAENVHLNERALTGSLPTKQTRATEIASGDRATDTLSEHMASRIEDVYIEPLAKLAFSMVLQNKKLLSDDDLIFIFYGDQEMIDKFKAMSAKECYNKYAHSFKFRGKGIRSIAAGVREAQLLMQMANIAASNPLLGEQFERSGIEMTMMFQHILRAQGIDIEKFKNPKTAEFAQQRALIREEALAAQEQQGGQQQAPQGAQQTESNINASGQVAGNDGNV